MFSKEKKESYHSKEVYFTNTSIYYLSAMSITQKEVINELDEKSNKPEKRYVRAVTRGKRDKYLNVSIPPEISARLKLTEDSYVKIYVDKANNLCFQKLEL